MSSSENIAVTRRPGRRKGFVELLFAAKPDETLRQELTAAGFRFNRADACWWGAESALPERYKNAAAPATEPATEPQAEPAPEEPKKPKKKAKAGPQLRPLHDFPLAADVFMGNEVDSASDYVSDGRILVARAALSSAAALPDTKGRRVPPDKVERMVKRIQADNLLPVNVAGYLTAKDLGDKDTEAIAVLTPANDSPICLSAARLKWILEQTSADELLAHEHFPGDRPVLFKRNGNTVAILAAIKPKAGWIAKLTAALAGRGQAPAAEESTPPAPAPVALRIVPKPVAPVQAAPAPSKIVPIQPTVAQTLADLDALLAKL